MDLPTLGQITASLTAVNRRQPMKLKEQFSSLSSWTCAPKRSTQTPFNQSYICLSTLPRSWWTPLQDKLCTRENHRLCLPALYQLRCSFPYLLLHSKSTQVSLLLKSVLNSPWLSNTQWTFVSEGSYLSALWTKERVSINNVDRTMMKPPGVRCDDMGLSSQHSRRKQGHENGHKSRLTWDTQSPRLDQC